MSRGILIQLPSGSKKSIYINNLNDTNKKKWLDGESLLLELGIKNKINYWYDNDNELIINKINKIINKILNKGFNVFISANPLKIKTDIIIIPDSNKRWKIHKNNKIKGKWSPNELFFTLEQQAFERASTKILQKKNQTKMLYA